MAKKNKIARTLGLKIKKLREEKGWTINQLALYAGVNPTSIMRAERGESELSLGNLLRIAKALKVDLNTLVEESMGQIKLGDEELVPEEKDKTPDIYEIIKKAENLNFKGIPVNEPDVKQAIVEAITFAIRLKAKEKRQENKEIEE
ncbi:transcriptional regulator, XRE family [Caldicellulosiruptor hydrothermalis 108]|uniref:Transcriptional regulator, XRE family n=1 Tax=Caldicellulosiruptor hydrothermalis (strain DSM 18901 / VKM B-2411 / 108) TaxID=632292 RepID=E4QB73_CALH1|nr:helix-turn-helix transcriptional regulator [Caldicellulosiruptor hydrothermalis]ADQ06051.1 transcriptional regulator, XRE family [Caldicellulosiruptor hydrothermalis 108]